MLNSVGSMMISVILWLCSVCLDISSVRIRLSVLFELFMCVNIVKK